VSGWIVIDDECNGWFGVVCTRLNVGDGSDVQNVVTDLSLVNNNMTGVLSAELGQLNQGHHLAYVGSWNNITRVLLFSNAFSVSLPASISLWCNLKLISLVRVIIQSQVCRSTGAKFFRNSAIDRCYLPSIFGDCCGTVAISFPLDRVSFAFDRCKFVQSNPNRRDTIK
jgi:hypothetical protein